MSKDLVLPFCVESFLVFQDGLELKAFIPSAAYFIGTMSGHTQSLGLDLSLQQQLRWVNMKHESDSLQCQLMAYLRRKFANQVCNQCGYYGRWT